MPSPRSGNLPGRSALRRPSPSRSAPRRSIANCAAFRCLPNIVIFSRRASAVSRVPATPVRCVLPMWWTAASSSFPRDVRSLPDFKLGDGEWEALSLPIDLAFFFRHGPQDKIVALYPSPAGATESLLSLEAWKALVADNPALDATPTRRRSPSGQPRGRAPPLLCGADRCLLRARRTDPAALARPFGRRGSLARDRRLFRAAGRKSQALDHAEELHA